MDREPFLLQFAEPVVELPRPVLDYDPVTRRNRLAGTSQSLGDDASLGWEGTVVTMTSESKDNVENDRILNEGPGLTPPRAVGAMMGTKKTGSGEQADPTDGDRSPDVRTGGRGARERLLGMLGTKKTDSHEQSDPTDGDRSLDVTKPIQNDAPDRLLEMLRVETSGTRVT
jgi:hypothetical protein